MPASDRSPTPATTLLGAEPQILVTDLAAACAFYRDKLGFRLAFSHGEPVTLPL